MIQNTERTIEIVGYPEGNILNLTQKQFDLLNDNNLVIFDDEWTEETPKGQWGFNNDDEEQIEELLKPTNVQFYLATYDAEELDEQPYKEVIAVFTEQPEDDGESYLCYARLRQHSTCSQSFLAEKCRKATEEEYKDLKTELESIGYNLNIL